MRFGDSRGFLQPARNPKDVFSVPHIDWESGLVFAAKIVSDGIGFRFDLHKERRRRARNWQDSSGHLHSILLI
jgi:hypothetical protein